MKQQWTTNQLIGAVAATAVVAAVVGMAMTREPAGSDIFLPNSPLYDIAVKESVKGLNGKKDEPAAPGEPCPDCGKVHAQPAVAQAALAPSAGGVSTNFFYCDNCKIYHPVVKPQKVDGFASPP